jgi:riboflavin biosynthesis pyrimidine reductase
MLAYWPSSTEAFAARMNQFPKVVFSRSGRANRPGAGSTTAALRDATRASTANDVGASNTVSGNAAAWADSAVAAGEPVEEITRLKRQSGKDILAHAGASFAQSLVQHALIDEYRLLVHAVALGRGPPLFAALQGSLE